MPDPTTPPADAWEAAVEPIAAIVHAAMEWAARQPGDTRPWQGGNSFAEHHARAAARKIVALSHLRAAWFTPPEGPLGPKQRCPGCGCQFEEVRDVDAHIEGLRQTPPVEKCPVCKQAGCSWGGIPANCDTWGKDPPPVEGEDAGLVERATACPDIAHARIVSPGERVPEIVMPTELRDALCARIADLNAQLAEERREFAKLNDAFAEMENIERDLTAQLTEARASEGRKDEALDEINWMEREPGEAWEDFHQRIIARAALGGAA